MFEKTETAKQISNPVLRAAFVAQIAHWGQKRRGTGEDFIAHPARVATAVALHNPTDEAAVCAAWLHDVVEDTPVTLEDITELFGEEIAELVGHLTNKSKEHSDVRRDRKALDRERLKGVSPTVKTIKMLDRLDNIRDCGPLSVGFIRKYCHESRLLAEVLADADPDLAERLLRAIDEREGALSSGDA